MTKIFKNELFNEPKVRMQRNMAALEDLEIFIYMFLRAKSLETVEEVFYFYRNTAGSNTKMTDLEKYYDAVYRAMKSTYEICHDLPSYKGCIDAVEFMLLKIYSYGINRCLYDQIARYGADVKNVKKYFDNVRGRELELIKELAALKSQIISLSYDQNSIVKERIPHLDIEIMKECDLEHKR